jgi:hypothetical protein
VGSRFSQCYTTKQNKKIIFSPNRSTGQAREGEVSSTNWYHRFAQHPFVGDLGVNSGVMLMDLGRMRAVPWTDRLFAIYTRALQPIWIFILFNRQQVQQYRVQGQYSLGRPRPAQHLFSRFPGRVTHISAVQLEFPPRPLHVCSLCFHKLL